MAERAAGIVSSSKRTGAVCIWDEGRLNLDLDRTYSIDKDREYKEAADISPASFTGIVSESASGCLHFEA